MAVHIIITGGTIDSAWFPQGDTAKVTEHSSIPLYFQGLKLDEEPKFDELFMKDSRELTQDDVNKIILTVEESEYKEFIVTHGTYTMADTARLIKSRLKRNDAVVILTGSMTPLNGFNLTDAGFNLGFALAKTRDLSPGVYLCMNGRVFDADEAEKDTANGSFYSKTERQS